MKKPYDLIGGHHHGEEVEVNDASNELDTANFPDSIEEASLQPEKYVRRHLDGNEFGEGYDCFAVSTDDDTETEALALLHLHSLDPRSRTASVPFQRST